MAVQQNKAVGMVSNTMTITKLVNQSKEAGQPLKMIEEPVVLQPAADVLIVQLGGQRFTWGGADLQTAGAARATYMAALRAADNHDLGPLIAFARS
ncbi:hypothetical protein ACYCVF_07470 [Bradyrhizobium sp. 1.29L]